MASNPTLLITIDNLIQRINKVKVFQDHLKLITTNLIRLQHDLNEPNAMKNVRHLQHDIEQTFTAINVVVTSCSEKEVGLNGVTYRDLESILLRLQTRLAQHQADLTDDYQTKVQILTNAYHEQQILVQKVFDEKMKQRLETIERNTKENTIEQLRLLREKHFDTIKLYLCSCIELHKSVPLTGLTGDTVAKVAQTFYQISSEDQIQLEHTWQLSDLPLTRTFIQFKPDKSTSFERNESRRLLVAPEASLLQSAVNRKDTSKGIWQRLISAPYMMSMIERDRYEQEEDVSEENIIRTKRWIVILGDPGSGKTSFARWLVRHLAQTLLLNGQHSTDYGPLRIPILIRIGEFAEILKEQPSLTLFDYIGKHKWMGKSIVDDPSISLDDLSCALQDYIKHGQALIILDGLDELPVSDQRTQIINIVENFVDTYVQTPTGASVFDNPHLSRLLDDPSRSGGNQLIVTSRIVGYHAAPLAGQFAHYTIRPMDMEHMKDFVDYWFFRVHQQLLDTLDLSIPNQGENHGEALKQELEKTENIGLLDVASNSCLMSFICSVAFSQLEGSALPTQRIRLYEAIVNSMLTLWSSKRSTIPIPDLIRILSDIASYIHGNSASGLIHEEKMKEICIQSMKDSSSENLQIDENIQEIEIQASEFVRIIREDVGILAARGESLYGFLHLTFQEYFSCLKLINYIDAIKEEKSVTSRSFSQKKVQTVAQSLRRHANDPRFRVPIALALGNISLSWSQNDFNYFCLEFIHEQDESSCLLPLGAYMLISYGNDLVNYPSHDVLFKALDCLMISAGQHKWFVVCPFLFDQITNAVGKLRHDIVSLWINNFLSKSPSHEIQTITALCHLLEGKPHEFENIKWLDQSSCLMLQYLSSLDSENNEFAIDRLLVKIAFTNHRLLPVNPTTFKEFLITHEIELNSIPVILFPLIITLYGGLKRDGETIVFDPFHIYRESTVVTPILIRFLSKFNCDRQDQNILIIKEELFRSLLTRIENQDESSEIVDLCIATMCLYGIDYVRKNTKTISNSLIRKSMNRFKYISMILRQFYFADNTNNSLISKKVTKFISSMIERFQYDKSSKVQFLDLLNSLRTSTARLQSSTASTLLKGHSARDRRVTLYLPNSLRKENDFLNHLLSTDMQFHPDRKSCSLIHYFTKLFWILEHNDEFNIQYRMAVVMDTIPEYLLFRNDEDLLFPLTFVSQHLRNLYLRLSEQAFIAINPRDLTDNSGQHLYFGHILLECLMVISNTSCKQLSIVATLLTLLPWLRMHRLENFGCSLLWTLSPTDSGFMHLFETTRQHPMNYETGLYINKVENFAPGNAMADEERRKLIEKYIEQEYERLRGALVANDETNMKLYSASVSLARVCRWSDDKNRLHLLEESVQGAMSINNKLVRLDALCIIALYSHSDYNQIPVNQERSLQKEIDYQLQNVYSDLPLLLHTAIFIRCLPLLQHQQTIDRCLQNLVNKFNDADQRDQQVVYEALSPYMKSTVAFSSVLEPISNSCLDYNKTINNKSSILMEHCTDNENENLSNSLLISNLYLVELASDLQKSVADDYLGLLVSHFNLCANDKPIAYKPFQLECSILTVSQAVTITSILRSIFSSDKSEKSKQIRIVLSNTLHRFNLVEFKARRLLESWMKWKDSNELFSFAYHAALLLINSDLWSVEAVTIVCDLLCCENDWFRQRAEMILRSKSDDDFRTSSKLGLDVFLTLITKKSYYLHTSPSANLTLLRVFESTTVDVLSHLEAVLWLERYRVHALANKEYFSSIPRFLPDPLIASYFPSDIIVDISLCDSICKISNDLVPYMCNLLTSNFLSFLPIEDDTTSNAVVESHSQFVASVLVRLITLFGNMSETRLLMIDALIILFETSKNDIIRRAVAYAFGYVFNKETYKLLFDKLQTMVNNETNGTTNDSDGVLSILISSYCHCTSVCNFIFDQHAMDLFRKLLKHPSQNVLKAVHVGLGRVLKNSTLLIKMLDSDYIQCYHALIGSTAYIFMYTAVQNSTDIAAELIEQHPDLLSIFIVELYNSILHFSDTVEHVKTMDFYLAYGYPQYVEVASFIAVRMPAAFCAFIKNWCDGDKLKRALFYTSKQHDFVQRAACLTILSIFGELTVELCEMIIEALRGDPHTQNTSYKCLNRITSVKDEKIVFNLLFSYLKSKSMNVRYVAAKMLLHLSQSCLIPSAQVQEVLNNLMLDPDSNEDLWLIEEQDNIQADCLYYYAGLLKDVIYSLLVRHLTGDASTAIRRNELNDIDTDFIESEKAARLASCLYEAKTEENVQLAKPAKIKSVD